MPTPRDLSHYRGYFLRMIGVKKQETNHGIKGTSLLLRWAPPRHPFRRPLPGTDRSSCKGGKGRLHTGFAGGGVEGVGP